MADQAAQSLASVHAWDEGNSGALATVMPVFVCIIHAQCINYIVDACENHTGTHRHILYHWIPTCERGKRFFLYGKSVCVRSWFMMAHVISCHFGWWAHDQLSIRLGWVVLERPPERGRHRQHPVVASQPNGHPPTISSRSQPWPWQRVKPPTVNIQLRFNGCDWSFLWEQPEIQGFEAQASWVHIICTCKVAEHASPRSHAIQWTSESISWTRSGWGCAMQVPELRTPRSRLSPLPLVRHLAAETPGVLTCFTNDP